MSEYFLNYLIKAEEASKTQKGREQSFQNVYVLKLFLTTRDNYVAWACMGLIYDMGVPPCPAHFTTVTKRDMQNKIRNFGLVSSITNVNLRGDPGPGMTRDI